MKRFAILLYLPNWVSFESDSKLIDGPSAFTPRGTDCDRWLHAGGSADGRGLLGREDTLRDDPFISTSSDALPVGLFRWDLLTSMCNRACSPTLG